MFFEVGQERSPPKVKNNVHCGQYTKSESSPIFIVGVGRSGTSLLQSMFAAHRDIAFAPETAFVRRYVAKGTLTKHFVQRGAKSVASLLSGDDYIQRTGLDIDKLLCEMSIHGSFTDGAVYRAMVAEVSRRENKPKYGDKDPRSVEFLGLIRNVLAGCHVVHVIRDPRDILVSKKKTTWSNKHGVLHHVFASRVQLRMGRVWGPRLFGNRYHELIYEKLLSDPERELYRLCRRLGLSFDPSMLDFQVSAKQLVSEKEMSWKKETLGPLLRDNQRKWVGSLSDWEIALTECACGAHFEAGGYERSYRVRGLPIGQRLAVYGMAGAIIALEPFYREYRHWTVRQARKYV
jgi:hypothetical protein